MRCNPVSLSHISILMRVVGLVLLLIFGVGREAILYIFSECGLADKGALDSDLPGGLKMEQVRRF